MRTHSHLAKAKKIKEKMTSIKDNIRFFFHFHLSKDRPIGFKQESIPVGCVPPAFVVPGGILYPHIPSPDTLPPRYPTPWIPYHQIPYPTGYLPPRYLTPWKGHRTRDTLPLEMTWDQRYPTPLWTEWLTDACENIVFLQLLLRPLNITWIQLEFLPSLIRQI